MKQINFTIGDLPLYERVVGYISIDEEYPPFILHKEDGDDDVKILFSDDEDCKENVIELSLQEYIDALIKLKEKLISYKGFE
jgi:hypothetical protein